MKKYAAYLFTFLITFGQEHSVAQQQDSLSIVAVGDMMLGTAFPTRVDMPKDDAIYAFKAFGNIIRQADLSIGNLEGVFLDQGKSEKCKGSNGQCFAFRMPVRYAQRFAAAGFDVLSVANNHSGDFGELGRAATAKALSKAGIAYAGFQSHPYTIYVKDGIKYGVCAFAPNEGTLSLLDLDAARSLIRDLNSITDVLIVFFHGGAEGAQHQHVNRQEETFYGQNRGNVYAFAHAVIDAGADLVLGSGPHVTRAVELYKNRLIAYSLGNFCTYGTFNLDGPNGIAPLLKVHVNQKGEFLSAQVTSVKQLKNQWPVADAKHMAWKYLKSLTQTDFPETELDFKKEGWIFPLKKALNAD